MADISKIKLPNGTTYDLYDKIRYNKTVSRGEQLVVNGNGMMGNNTNFSYWEFDGSYSNSSPGSFTRTSTSYANIGTDDFFPVDAGLKYRFDFDLISKNNTGTMYAYLGFYDVDKIPITASDTMFYSGTLTTLARDLKEGDTLVYLTDASNYKTYGTGTHLRMLTFWDYTNSFGYLYPPETYSRNHIFGAWVDDSSIDKTNNTITLATAYTGKTRSAGTYVSQGCSGSIYKYSGIVGTKVPTEWTHYTGYFDGTDYSGLNKYDTFVPATAYCKVGFLWDYNSANDQFWVTNISVKEVPALAKKAETATNANNATSATSANSLKHSTTLNADTIDSFHPADLAYANVSNLSGIGLAGNDGVVVWIPWNAGYGRQLIIEEVSNQTIYSRTYNNGTWTDWVNISYRWPNDPVQFWGNQTSLGSGTPAAATKTFWENSVPNNNVSMAYNNSGAEFSILYGRGSGGYGSILKWGYSDKYIRMLRRYASKWTDDDWVKMDAGNADTVNGHTVNKDVPADAKFTDTTISMSMDTTDTKKLIISLT